MRAIRSWDGVELVREIIKNDTGAYSKIMDRKEIEGVRGKIRGVLKKYDPDIVEIIQFGSSVYAPEYARDVDLLVITKKKKRVWGIFRCYCRNI